MKIHIAKDVTLAGVPMVLTHTYECTTHRRYQALRKPRVPCEMCWRMWIARYP